MQGFQLKHSIEPKNVHKIGHFLLIVFQRNLSRKCPQILSKISRLFRKFYGTSSKTQLMEGDMQTSETVGYCI